MKCQLCNVEAAIAKSRHVVSGDDSPDTETKLYMEQEIRCRNPNCSNYNKIIATVRNELPVSKDFSQME